MTRKAPDGRDCVKKKKSFLKSLFQLELSGTFIAYLETNDINCEKMTEKSNFTVCGLQFAFRFHFKNRQEKRVILQRSE